jgi:DNA-binding NtrC family response regulator
VDDEPCTLSTLRRVLRAQFEIVSRQDPLAALALVQQGSQFAVVIADMNMPGMTGLELVRAIGAISPTTAHVMWTGDVVADPTALVRDGVFRSLSKQCSLETLRQTIADAAGQHARHGAANAAAGHLGG